MIVSNLGNFPRALYARFTSTPASRPFTVVDRQIRESLLEQTCPVVFVLILEKGLVRCTRAEVFDARILRAMEQLVSIQTASPRLLAAVRRQVRMGQVASAWRPALNQVWEFLRENPGLRTDGHNIFLYHHPKVGEATMVVDFGVQVTRPFPPAGEVTLTVTPAGKVASALHIGPYERLGETHQAIQAWAGANDVKLARKSWEIYGDWTEDPAKLETQVEYLLAGAD